MIRPNELLQGLRAAGEPTRLRILVALRSRELTVSELCRVLDQSQPRISRHLKVLVEAGLLERRSEGSSAFFRRAWSGHGRELIEAIEPMVDYDADEFTGDRERIDFIRSEQASKAEDYFNELAEDWESVRSLHVADQKVEAAVLKSLGKNAGTILDVGTGTGRMLEICANRIGRGIGIDISPPMLQLARVRLDAAGATNCTVRRGSVYSLEVDRHSVDAAILHHVLHFLDEPGRAVTEAARALAPGGRLVVVDFAPHQVEELRNDYGHRRLGYEDAEVAHWFENAGLTDVEVRHLRPRSSKEPKTLTTTIWTASAPDSAVSPTQNERTPNDRRSRSDLQSA